MLLLLNLNKKTTLPFEQLSNRNKQKLSLSTRSVVGKKLVQFMYREVQREGDMETPKETQKKIYMMIYC